MAPRGDLQLSIGYWIVSHKQTLRTWWAISFMAIIAFCLLWAIAFFTIFFSQDNKINAGILSVANGLGGYRTTVFKPQALTVGATQVIGRDGTHIDAVVELTNPNQAWAGQTVTAHFVIDGQALSPLNVFINQADHRPVIQLNAAVKNSSTAAAELVIDDVSWARAVAAGMSAAVFSVKNIVTTPSTVVINGQTQASLSVQAEVTNNSVYNFYHVDVPIVLLSGERIVGAGQVGIDRWPTSVMRPVVLTVAYPVPDVTTVRIEPQVNRFDAGNTYR